LPWRQPHEAGIAFLGQLALGLAGLALRRWLPWCVQW
jgi:hypothetical protein